LAQLLELSLGSRILRRSDGLGLGLITSYFVHKEVATDRETSTRQTEIYFGDLPPSPFIIPSLNQKKGGR
jgi:hypothetical protein